MKKVVFLSRSYDLLIRFSETWKPKTPKSHLEKLFFLIFCLTLSFSTLDITKSYDTNVQAETKKSKTSSTTKAKTKTAKKPTVVTKKKAAKVFKRDVAKTLSQRTKPTKGKKKTSYRSIGLGKSKQKSKPVIKSYQKKASIQKKQIDRSITYDQIKSREETVSTSPRRGVSKGEFGLDKVKVSYSKSSVNLETLPTFETEFSGRIAAISEDSKFVFFPTNIQIQRLASEIVKRAGADHIGLAVMNPKTGEVLALAGKSRSLEIPEMHASYPAASLFKVITTATGVELGKIHANSLIQFRGSNYTLEQWNYFPSPSRDNRNMSVEEALGKSCNPVFGRIALNYLSANSLQNTANRFGFNDNIFTDYNLDQSKAYIPNDDYGLSRTGAGFGQVTLSPIHAVTVMSAIANGGVLMKPRLVDRVVDTKGNILYKSQATSIRRVVEPKTANQVLEMMEATTLIGTSRREFTRGGERTLPWRVAAKTGTLNGSNPRGLTQWFIAAAPISDPQIAVAIVTVNKRNSLSSPAHIGKLLIEEALE